MTASVATRKTRTRKATKTTAKRSVIKVTETPKTVAPEPLLKWEDYKNDAKIRCEIHQFETKALWKDCVWVYNESVPYVKKAYNYVLESYNRAFNTEQQPVK